ncbi:hypothetical protein GCM10025787_01120 [Saccharopolyspora rosea]
MATFGAPDDALGGPAEEGADVIAEGACGTGDVRARAGGFVGRVFGIGRTRHRALGAVP